MDRKGQNLYIDNKQSSNVWKVSIVHSMWLLAHVDIVHLGLNMQ